MNVDVLCKLYPEHVPFIHGLKRKTKLELIEYAVLQYKENQRLYWKGVQSEPPAADSTSEVRRDTDQQD